MQANISPPHIDTLLGIIKNLQQSNAELIAKCETQQDQIDKLTLTNDALELEKAAISTSLESAEEKLLLINEEVERLRRKFFCPKSEKSKRDHESDFSLLEAGGIDIGQIQEEPEEVDDPEEKQEPEKEGKGDSDPPKKKRPRHKNRRHNNVILSDDLPVEDVYEDDNSEKICECGANLDKCGEIITEKFEYVPGHFKKVRHHRPVFKCRNCEPAENEGPSTFITPIEDQILPNSILGNSILVRIVVLKFQYAVSLYRQEIMFQSEGVTIPRSTMSRAIIDISEALDPLYELFLEEIRAGEVINVDETTFQVLKEEDRSNTTKSQLWSMCGGNSSGRLKFFYYSEHANYETIHDLLSGDPQFSGFLQTDGKNIYEKLKDSLGVTHVSCLAHIRRKFVEAQKSPINSNISDCKEILLCINEVFKIEKELRSWNLDRNKFLEVRSDLVKPILDSIFNRVKDLIGKVPQKSLFGKALNYALEQLPDLYNFLLHYHLTSSNNIVENSIKAAKLGIKNFLFAGCPKGAKALAKMYTFIESAKINMINPDVYIAYLFANYNSTPLDQLRKLLPYNTGLPRNYIHVSLYIDYEDNPYK